jgi:hypothetical protein
MTEQRIGLIEFTARVYQNEQWVNKKASINPNQVNYFVEMADGVVDIYFLGSPSPLTVRESWQHVHNQIHFMQNCKQ